MEEQNREELLNLVDMIKSNIEQENYVDADMHTSYLSAQLAKRAKKVSFD